MNDTKANTLTYEFYEGFQRVEFHRWDAIVAEDLLLNSPAGFGIRGLKTFKEFAVQIRRRLLEEELAPGKQSRLHHVLPALEAYDGFRLPFADGA